MTHTQKVNAYIRDVLKGKIPACRWVKLACQRQKNDLERAKKTDFPYRFDKEKAEKVCKFIENLPHTKGVWASRGELIRLEPWQQFILTTLFGWVRKDNGFRRFREAYVEVPRKNGKALHIDTLVPTPDGWSTMGQLSTGDTVFDENGKICNVVATTEIMVNRPCYRLTFSNGETVIADALHEWLTTARVNMPGERKLRTLRRFKLPRLFKYSPGKSGRYYWYAQLYGKQKYIGPCDKLPEKEAKEIFNQLAANDLEQKPFGDDSLTRIRTTEEIYNCITYGSRCDFNHTIQMPAPLQTPPAELPIPPYSFGAWLGDGTSRTAQISCGDKDMAHFKSELERDDYVVGVRRDRTAWRLLFSANDNGVIVRRNDPRNVTKQLRRLGVLQNKHIPHIYLRSSFEQRLALLQGLMDTDGTISKSGQALQFVTISKALCDDVAELLASMGLKYSVIEKKLRCNGEPVKGIGYSIQFNAFRCDMPVFRLQRKLERMRIRNGNVFPRSRSVQIVGCEPIPPVPVRCIQVDSPSNCQRKSKIDPLHRMVGN